MTQEEQIRKISDHIAHLHILNKVAKSLKNQIEIAISDAEKLYPDLEKS